MTYRTTILICSLESTRWSTRWKLSLSRSMRATWRTWRINRSCLWILPIDGSPVTWQESLTFTKSFESGTPTCQRMKDSHNSIATCVLHCFLSSHHNAWKWNIRMPWCSCRTFQLQTGVTMSSTCLCLRALNSKACTTIILTLQTVISMA